MGGRVGVKDGNRGGSRSARESKAARREELGCTKRADPGGGGTSAGGARLTNHEAVTEGRVEEGSQCASDDTKKEQDDTAGMSGVRRGTARRRLGGG
jgi:hypothetical protein